MSCSFSIMRTIAWGLIKSWKLCLNLSSLKWLKHSRSRLIGLVLLGLWQLKTELETGVTDQRIFFRNIDKLLELRRPGCGLFHSEIVKGRKEFLKKLFYVENGNGIYIPRSVRWASHKRRSLRSSKPNSWYNFFLDVPLSALVFARQELYWIDSSLFWKELLKSWSYKMSSYSRWGLTKAL